MIREGRSPAIPWLPSDRLLSVALTLHDQGTAACGHPLDAYDPDAAANWTHRTAACAACAAEEQYRAEHTKPAPGEKVFAVKNTTSNPGEGEVLPTYD